MFRFAQDLNRWLQRSVLALGVAFVLGATGCSGPGECRTDRDCDEGQLCDIEGVCVEVNTGEPGTCETNEDCGPDNVCTDGQCQPAEIPAACESNSDCRTSEGEECVQGFCIVVNE